MTTTTSYGTWYNAAASSSGYEADRAAWAESGVDLNERVNAALPDGVRLLGNGEFVGPAYTEDRSPAHVILDEQDDECEVCGRESGWLHNLVHTVAADA